MPFRKFRMPPITGTEDAARRRFTIFSIRSPQKCQIGREHIPADGGNSPSFDVHECPDRFIDRFDESKRFREFFQDIPKFNELSFIDDADDHVTLRVAVCPRRLQTGCAVMQFFKNYFFYFVDMGSNNEELISRFCAFDDHISHKTGKETIQHAEANRFIIVNEHAVFARYRINKIRGYGDRRVNCEIYPEKIELRGLFAYIFCDNVCSARR